jgi:tRNA-2-methylthio-N6-dimethylallyladenosine synthase
MSFAELLAAVAEVPGIRRVRFTTSHPREFGQDIIDVIDAIPTLCDHIHLPVQSGSTRVLDAMQRLYTREQYLEKIAWIRAAQRNISITSDIIIGFPGETEAEFQETLSLLDECQFDAIFAFKYSARPNTPSLHMPDALPEEEKSRRLLIMQERQRDIQKQRNLHHINQTLEVMVESRNEARGQWTGRSSQNKTVNFTGSNCAPGSYTSVRITSTFPNSLVGELVV